ncbi:nicotinamidase-like amidase [Spongiibacter sp. IMCC21906]|uniref:isochorismatase family cysteine hydrolase n=1 Tax=Spongiibacter sp. IMCC21906 TaxID=1620392 RepID=UPI00062DE0EE|nr:isochorismatase family cysteine hydrolase [Spongiibacter sp. IMCC21906]AKH68685.1 nicotinamidase-like amidase [Spongiibacter sp. IMCC21906]
MNTLNLLDQSALLINECQRGLLEAEHSVLPGITSHANTRQIVPRIAALAAAFREQGLPVIYINVEHRVDFAGVSINNPAVAYIHHKKGLLEGSPQVDIVDGLAPQPTDHIVRRYSGMTAFYGNHLESLLHNLQRKCLVLAGVSTNAAIPGMLLGGLDRGYHIVIPEDAIAGSSQQAHDAIVEHMLTPLATLTTSKQVITALTKAD